MTVRLSPRHLGALLQTQAARHGSLPLYRYLGEGRADGAVETWTIDEVHRRAQQVAAALSQKAPPGSRALLLFPPGLDFIAAFFGCAYAGVIAVPIPPPDPRRLSATLPRLLAVARDADPSALLTASAFIGLAEGLGEQAALLASLPAVAVDDLPIGATWEPHPADPDDVAFLQYTSGSTGEPKGVQVTHRNLLANGEMIDGTLELGGADLTVSWLPTFHDMGLMGSVIQPLAHGCPAVIMSPLDFLQRPLSWLEAISRFRGTVCGGPNFAYELCARRATPEVIRALDLSSWRVAFCGAEPVRPATLERFAQVFAPCGFNRSAFFACYGLAEATVFVSGPRPGTGASPLHVDSDALAENRIVPGEGRTFVGCGQARDMEVRVVEPERREVLSEGRVGEIWVRGPNVATGYWRKPELSREVFGATLADGGGDRFLRTGDLGFLHEGQLFLCGRRKDLVIIRGRNLYPQDLEHSAERAHPALRVGCTAAFSIDDGTEEKLVVVSEANEGHPELASAFAAIRRALSEEHGVEPHAIALIRPRTLPKTSSGKLQRSACREAWRAGTLDLLVREEGTDPPAPPPGPGGVLPWMLAWLRQRTSVPVLKPEMTFAEAGLDSLAATQLAADLEAWLGFEVPVELFFGTHLDQTAALLEHGQRSVGAGDRQDLEKDAALDPSIAPHGPPPPAPAGAPILLTGATGFLGGALLRELLEQTSSKVVCLTRGASAASARERVLGNLARSGSLSQAHADRVSVMVGDLSRPSFGWPAEDFDRMAREVGSILHCGAVIHWGRSYRSLRDSNVGGTREVIRLSCAGGGLPIHSISSIGVYPFGEVVKDLYPEDEDLTDGDRLQIPYFQTKWAAERMLEHARRRGVPVTVYRPGFITGDSRTGEEPASESQLVYAFLAGVIQLGEVPGVEKVIDVVPVDWVARAIVTLLRDPRAVGRRFNLVNGRPFRQRDLYAALREWGYELREVAFPRWRERVLALGPDDANPLGRFTLYYRKVTEARMARMEAQMARRMPVEDRNTRELLEGRGVECPAFDAALLRTYVDFYVRRGLLPPPPRVEATQPRSPERTPPPPDFGARLLDSLAPADARLASLYEKGKERQWNAARRIDWSLDLDPENPQDLPDTAIPLYGSDLFRKMSRAERARLRHHYQAWQISQFMHGEQGALLCAARIVQQCPRYEGRLYAATQTVDEARHLEVFSRLLREKFELSYSATPPLLRLLEDILRDSRWDMTCLGMQVLVEGLALAAFASTRDHSRNPLAASINAYVMEDEARHVAFGRLLLEGYYRELSAAELREREEFVLEASHLLRDRFQAAEVWDELGLPAAACTAWMHGSGFHRTWQAQLFSRIVPSIRAIGLWGPRVRETYAQMGVLRFGEVDLEELHAQDEQIARQVEAGARAEAG